MSRRRRRHWLDRAIVTVLVLGGAAFFIQPVIANYLNGQASAQRTSEYVSEIQAIESGAPGQLSQSLREARDYNATLTPETLHDPWADDDLPGDQEQVAYGKILSDTGAMARVSVPSVNIDLPVFHGTDRATLNRGAGHMYGSSLPVGGAGTHAVISAHTGMKAHTFFDRLVEVKKGDLFHIDVAGERLTYQVDNISLVLPHEVDAMAAVPGEDLVTLLTCYTPPENTHRLLVRGHLVANAGVESTATAEPSVASTASAADAVPAPADQGAVDYSIQQWMWPRIAGAGFAVALWLFMILGWRRSDRRLKTEDGAPKRAVH